MKGAIINPLWFYLIDVLGNVKDIMFVILIILIIFGFGALLFLPILLDFFDDIFEDEKLFFKFLKKVVIFLLIIIGVFSIIPSKETMYTMMVANYVTYENVEAATDVIQDSVDYIMDKLGENDE